MDIKLIEGLEKDTFIGELIRTHKINYLVCYSDTHDFWYDDWVLPSKAGYLNIVKYHE